MDATAFSIYAFGTYEIMAGLGFLAFPNSILSFLRMEKSIEPWIRIVGILAILIGYYHFMIGRLGINDLYWPTIYARILFIVLLALLVLAKKAPKKIILFGIASLLSTIWTYWTLI